VMDWHSRFVLSWEVSITMETDFCINAVKSAIRRHGKPEVFNSDQGAQYTSTGFTDILKENDIKISMDGKGCPASITLSGRRQLGWPVFSRA